MAKESIEKQIILKQVQLIYKYKYISFNFNMPIKDYLQVITSQIAYPQVGVKVK